MKLSETLRRYLTQGYQRDILRESVLVETPPVTEELLTEIKTELARINGLRLGANLVNRDFALAQRKRALEALLAQLEPPS